MADPRESVLCVKIHRYMGNLDHEGLNWESDHAWEMLEPVVALEAKLETQKKIDKALLHQLETERKHVDALMEVGRDVVYIKKGGITGHDTDWYICHLCGEADMGGPVHEEHCPMNTLPPELKEAFANQP